MPLVEPPPVSEPPRAPSAPAPMPRSGPPDSVPLRLTPELEQALNDPEILDLDNPAKGSKRPDPNKFSVDRRRKFNEEATRQIIATIDTLFWQHGNAPTADLLYTHFTELTRYRFNKLLRSDPLRKQLEARGLPHPEHSAGPLVTPRQALALQIMINPMDKRSERLKLETLNETLEQASETPVRMAEWNAWRRLGTFQALLDERAKHLFGSSKYKFFQALETSVEQGDTQAMKIYGQLTGLFDANRVTIAIEVDSLVASLFEILSKHLAPEVLETVGRELDVALKAATTAPVGPSKELAPRA